MSTENQNTFQPILFITEELLKIYSPITNNVEIVELLPFISFAQTLFIEPILGVPLSEELKGQISDDDVSPENADLILKIAPALSFYTVYQSLPFLWSSILNKGITIRNSENSTSIGINDLSQLRLWLKSDAEVFSNQLIDFLCECQDSYPLWRPTHEYLCQKCKKDSEGSNIKSYDSGIYMKKKVIF
jgi:hypothetical protein